MWKSLLESLDSFRKTIHFYTTPEDHQIGLLRYDKPPVDDIFIFVFPTEEELIFHTLGMNFNIDILFYNKHGHLVNKYKNCKPGRKHIRSILPASFVVEIPRKEED